MMNIDIDEYLQRGFGSMNKNDFEVLIFSQLLKNGYLTNLSDYETSIKLKIPQTKVKRLRYECELKYTNEEALKSSFKAVLKNAKFKKDSNNDKVYFVIENQILRKYIDSLLKKDGRFLDSSFNSEIVALYIDDFVFLLEHVYTPDEIKGIKHLMQQKDNTKQWDFKGIVSAIIDGALNQLGAHVLDLTIEGITNLINILPL